MSNDAADLFAAACERLAAGDQGGGGGAGRNSLSGAVIRYRPGSRAGSAATAVPVRPSVFGVTPKA